MIELTSRSVLYIGFLIICNHFSYAQQQLQDWGEYENVKQDAIERINKHRKGNTTLSLIMPDGKVVSNTETHLKLTRHEFKWGAVVSGSMLNSPYLDIQKKNFLKYFNASGFGVALKPKHRGTEREALATELFPWFLEHDIYMRGHALTWEGERFLSKQAKKIYTNPKLTDAEKEAKLLKVMGSHFNHAIKKWDVQCWDVSNEPIANNIVNDLNPDVNSHVEWFKLADKVRKMYGKNHVKLFQNDYQIISSVVPKAFNQTKKGYKSVGRIALYAEIIQEQLEAGAPIEGIGFQSRIKGGLITPDSIYNRLVSFEKFNLPYHGTEFEVRDQERFKYTDEQRKLITEYMMILYFSHPNVEGFWHWTFADMNPNRPLDYTLFTYDGKPKSTGEKWIELMEGFLNTDEIITSTAKGKVDFKGYYGTYEATVKVNGKNYTGTFELASDAKQKKIPVQLQLTN